MDTNVFKGCGTAMFTPFKEGGIDVEALAATARRQVAAGIDFLVPLGTTGETPTLSDEEKLLVYRTVRSNAGGLPVVVGVGSNSVAGTLANMKLLEEADAFLVVVPFYNKPPQRGIYTYFKTIAGATAKPVILYNVPGRTGSNCEAETTLALAQDVPNIVAVKEASGKLEQIRTILARRPAGFSVLSGNDDDTLTLMKDGADGVVSVASNVCPQEMASFVHAASDGNWTEASALDERLHPLFEALFVEPNPIPGKAAMAQLGLMDNTLRLPLVPALDTTETLMQNVLDELWKK
ncbi:MAG: 4-hydroxy-tetrahydrodipicolinate synthase [Bacteroidales bacterium]|nr:4-hydroxy-tetrahydrodipicolinate synthase [Bacteroidales bacterium]